MVTDISKLQQVAKTLLYCDINIDETFPFIAHHPIFSQTIYPIKIGDSISMLNLANDDELEIARKDMISRIERTTETMDFVMIINKPYLPAFFKFAHRHMSVEDYSAFLGEMWVYVEFPNRDSNISALQFVKMFANADKKHLMSEEDMKSFDALPNIVRIYRGVNHGGTSRALSWTISKDTASWFANRWNGDDATIFTAEIAKEHVLAYFGGRDESEVVVDFRKLQNIQECC